MWYITDGICYTIVVVSVTMDTYNRLYIKLYYNYVGLVLYTYVIG
jgi:hypothetical protein